MYAYEKGWGFVFVVKVLLKKFMAWQQPNIRALIVVFIIPEK